MLLNLMATIGAGLPAPTSINLTGAQAQPYQHQSISTTQLAGSQNGRGSRTVFVMDVTGTDFIFRANSTSANLFDVSIDGSVPVKTTQSSGSGRYDIFRGQPHATRSVILGYGSSFSTNPNFVIANTDTFTITGQPPSITTAPYWIEPFDTNTVTSIFKQANAANFTPINLPSTQTLYV